jgi:ADP-ribose pyrophosphatase YjhB (NUDIX family)
VTDRFALVPASYVYLLRDGADGTEVLLQRRGPVPYMAGHWAAAAAGHVEPGETAYDAARREALEELGITDVDLDFVLTMQRSQFGPGRRGAGRLVLHRALVDRRAADRRAREGGIAGLVRAGRAPGADGAARGARPRAPLLRGRLPHLRVGRSPERGWPERHGHDRID